MAIAGLNGGNLMFFKSINNRIIKITSLMLVTLFNTKLATASTIRVVNENTYMSMDLIYWGEACGTKTDDISKAALPVKKIDRNGNNLSFKTFDKYWSAGCLNVRFSGCPDNKAQSYRIENSTNPPVDSNDVTIEYRFKNGPDNLGSDYCETLSCEVYKVEYYEPNIATATLMPYPCKKV